MVQWLRLYASSAGGTGSILGEGTKIPRAKQWGQKKNPIIKIKNKINRVLTHSLQQPALETVPLCTLIWPGSQPALYKYIHSVGQAAGSWSTISSSQSRKAKLCNGLK